MAIFPGAISTDSDLYIAVNNQSTVLTDNPLTIGATTVNVSSTTNFPTVGFISIDAEVIKYTGKTATSFTGCTRGADGTTAASHLLNAQVDHNVTAAHHNASKDEIIATQQFISDLIGRTNSQIKTPNGSVTVPSHSFASETNTGIYLPSANQLSFGVAGVLRARITTAGLNLDSGSFFLNASGAVIQNQDGSAALPSYSFGTATSTGLYKTGTNSLRIASGGVNIASIVSSGFEINSGQLFAQDGTVALPSHSFINDPDTGLYSVAANRIGIATGGVVRWTINSDGAFESGTSYIIGGDGSVSAPAFSFSNDQNTGMYRIGTDNIGWGTGGSLRMNLDSSGHLHVGDSTTVSDSFLTVSNVSGGAITVTGDFVTESYRNLSNGAGFYSHTGRGSFASKSVVQSGDVLGFWYSRGYDGTTIRDAAAITTEVDGTPGASDMPGRIRFFTTPDGSATLSEAMRINSSQQLSMQSHKIISLLNGTAVQDAAAFGQVKILQVVQASATAEVSTTSATYTDTGLTASITPSNTSNKVLVIVAQNIRHRVLSGGSTNATAGLRLTRNSTDIISDQQSSLTVAATGDYNSTSEQIMIYLDSPATTSSTTYKTRIARNGGTGTIYVQDGSTASASWITLIEVNGL